MNKRTTFILSGTLLLGVAMLSIVINFQKTDRAKYDSALHKVYEKAWANRDFQKADNPDDAAMQNYFMTFDPETQTVPAERLYAAYQHTNELKAAKAWKSSDELDWTEITSNMGGRTRALLWDPNDPDGTKIWAGSVTGGLWYNNDIYDENSEWVSVDDFWPSLSVSSIVCDPLDPMTMYVGTGEYQTAREIYRESSGVGIGIWRSTDGGESWEIITSTEDFKYISDLKIRDEEGISVLYAGVVSGVYKGMNHQSIPNDGLYRSTDGGDTWEQVLPDIDGLTVPYSPADLDVGPEGRIFVGTLKNLDGDGGATILFSDEGTSGSWTVFDDYEAIIQADPNYYIPGRVIMASAASDASRVYAIVGAGYYNNYNFNYSKGGYVLKSSDGGETWTETNLPGGDPDWASLSWHAFIASVCPADPDRLFVGGLDVWKTANGGSSWQHLSDWAGMYYGGGDDYVHADQHVQLYKTGSSDEMIFGTDGGVFYTDNATNTYPDFQEKNKNLSTLQFYSVDIYPVPGSDYLVGGLQDNGTLLHSGDPLDINDMVDGGDGAYCFFDEDEPSIMITSTYYNSYTVFMNWSYHTDMGDYGTGVFINPADYDSENNILYANGVNFNGNYSNRILRISGIPNYPNDQLVNLNLGLNTYFSHVKVSPFSPEGTSTLFLGTQNGRLFKVTDAQASPDSEEIGSDDFPTAYISSMAVGGSEDTLLVTFSNYGVPSVWQTYDGGESWNDISGNLPDMPIRWAIYHPENAKQVMLATEVGIWTTDVANADEVLWEPDAGMPNVRVDMLQMRIADNTVAAATHGRGLMYATWDYNPSTGIKKNSVESVQVFPNPASDYIQVGLGANEKASVKLIAPDGKLVFEGEVSGDDRIDLNGLPDGLYIVSIQNDRGNIKSSKFLKQ